MRALFVLIFCVVSLIGTFAQSGEIVRLAIGEWAPYTSELEPHGKLLERVVTEAFKLEGVEVQYTYLPWRRSYLRTLDGTFDGTLPWNRSAERELLFYIHATPLLAEPGVFFHLKTTPFDWNRMEDLRNYRMGVTMGYKNEKVYKELAITADAAPSEELNFKKIAAGRIDVYETSRAVGYATIAKTLPPEVARQFTHHSKPAEVYDYFVLFSRKTPSGQAWAIKFESGLRKLKASGAYDRILTH